MSTDMTDLLNKIRDGYESRLKILRLQEITQGNDTPAYIRDEISEILDELIYIQTSNYAVSERGTKANAVPAGFTLKTTFDVQNEGFVSLISWSPNGRYLVAGLAGRKLRC